MARCRPFARSRSGQRHLAFQRRRQQRAHGLPQLQQRVEQRWTRNHRAQHRTLDRLRERALHFALDEIATDIHQPAVLHAGGTGGLARTAGEAAVEVQLCPLGHRAALKHLLHQIDAPTRAVEFVAEQLIGRTGRGAEAAMHARAQDRVGLLAFGRVAYVLGEVGFHFSRLTAEARRRRENAKRSMKMSEQA